MKTALGHNSIGAILRSLSESKVLNLETSIRQLVDPIGAVMAGHDGSEVAIHVLCCNEYAIVTGAQASGIEEIRTIAQMIGSLASMKAQNQG